MDFQYSDIDFKTNVKKLIIQLTIAEINQNNMPLVSAYIFSCEKVKKLINEGFFDECIKKVERRIA